MKYLTEPEQKLLLKTVKEIKGKRAERDYMILFLGFNAGLRRAEIAGLTVEDIRDKASLYVRPETAKRSKSRTIPLNPKLQAAIKNFLKLKRHWKERLRDESPLFISKKNNRLSERSINDLFEYWCIRAGLTAGSNGSKNSLYSPHSMRHSFAMRLLERDVKLPVVQKLLGHTSLASTGIYLEASKEDMDEAVGLL